MAKRSLASNFLQFSLLSYFLPCSWSSLAKQLLDLVKFDLADLMVQVQASKIDLFLHWISFVVCSVSSVHSSMGALLMKRLTIGFAP